MMKKIITTLLLVLPLSVFASVGGVELQEADVDVSDYDSLQRGAKNYVKYCLGCHSLKHIRYKRMAMDFEVEDSKILKEIAPTGARIYDQMHTAMNGHDSTKWFGTQPPDLSLVARSRGADWLYSYLKSFYLDSSPVGSNNLVFEDVGMPNVLWQLQGIQSAVYAEDEHGNKFITNLVKEEAGTLSDEEFDLFVNDLVNFLDYVGEPTQLERKSMGKYVLFFLFMFFVLAYLLKKEYWKDIH